MTRSVHRAALGSFLLARYITGSSAVHGVAPSEQAVYSGSTFNCLDQRGSVPSSAIDDDFCDCMDGSDEPGTGACAGLGRKQRFFYCPNAHSAPQYLYLSRVGDGVCDCCDGSDEWQNGRCGDVCEEHGRAQREKLREMRKSMERGIEKKRLALEAGQGKSEVWDAKLKELQVALKGQEATIALAKDQFDQAAAQFEESMKNSTAAALTHVESDASGSGEAEGEKKISEYAKWMEKDAEETPSDSSAGGWRNGQAGSGGIELISAPRKVLRKIKVRCGDLLDFVEFHYDQGAPLITGGGEGQPKETFMLEPEEYVVEIQGGQGGLLDGVTFVTNRGRESIHYGGGGGDPFKVKASAGRMIIGLVRSDGVAPKIKQVQECPVNDVRSAEERHRDEAQEKYDFAKKTYEDTKQEINDLEGKMATDFTGPRAAYRLFDTCGTATLSGYRYSICVFGDAKQDHTRLGTWQDWDGPGIHSASYGHGERCFSGITRSLHVTFECGEEVNIRSVKEPSQCTYEASMTHPAACDAELFEEGVSLRPIYPHESRSEL